MISVGELLVICPCVDNVLVIFGELLVICWRRAGELLVICLCPTVRWTVSYW